MSDRILYHYTSIDTMLKIASGSIIFASNLRYSNDLTEARYGRDSICRELRVKADALDSVGTAFIHADRPADVSEFGERQDRDFWADQLRRLSSFLSGQNYQRDFGPYGVCFSRRGDQLSQWRDYGKGGCSIGVAQNSFVNTTELNNRSNEHLLDDPHAEPIDLHSPFFDVLYGPKGCREVLEQVGQFAYNSALTKENATSFPDILEGEFHLAELNLSRLKHKGFKEEKEVRLLLGRGITLHKADVRPIIKYRARGLPVVPYIEVPINRNAIREIVIAPGADSRRKVEAAEEYAKSLGMDCTVRRSSIPYR